MIDFVIYYRIRERGVTEASIALCAILFLPSRPTSCCVATTISRLTLRRGRLIYRFHAAAGRQRQNIAGFTRCARLFIYLRISRGSCEHVERSSRAPVEASDTNIAAPPPAGNLVIIIRSSPRGFAIAPSSCGAALLSRRDAHEPSAITRTDASIRAMHTSEIPHAIPGASR